ncbi:P1 family peptidase [Roseitranquillus sediminis]|uniref:P1 family peptidase n=1 Tax=Roseitranquillus sediminis TaxID=2809051 RepID=UPI001D0C30FE|nr:P1 family peptidase [Roseitranquillus sediminis]MBM9594858.1 P1 family peptidase [Roseitranquillus sediminis]
MRPGSRNLLTDVEGLLVGNATDPDLCTGVTVVTSEQPFAAAVHVMGGAPGTRETDLLDPSALVDQVDALVLSGGSAFGLAAAQGTMEALARRGRGFAAGGHRVPIVPAAILFDLGQGTPWTANPYPALGAVALEGAGPDFALGSVGAGTGGTVAGLRGGLGSASARLSCGATVGALVAVNAVGAVTMGDGPHFWAAPWELEDEFGGFGTAPSPAPEPPLTKLTPGTATTIAVVATDVALSKAEARRMAVAAHDGLARAIVPSHTPFDGDLVFAASTGARPLEGPLQAMILGHAAATCLARAVARGVWRASGGASAPSWQERFGISREGTG